MVNKPPFPPAKAKVTTNLFNLLSMDEDRQSETEETCPQGRRVDDEDEMSDGNSETSSTRN